MLLGHQYRPIKKSSKDLNNFAKLIGYGSYKLVFVWEREKLVDAPFFSDKHACETQINV